MNLNKKISKNANKPATPATPQSLLKAGFINVLKQLEFMGETNSTESQMLLQSYQESLDQKQFIDPVLFIQKEKNIQDDQILNEIIRRCKGNKVILEWTPSTSQVDSTLKENPMFCKLLNKFAVVLVSVEESNVFNIAGLSPSTTTIAAKYIINAWKKEKDEIPFIGECVIIKELHATLLTHQKEN